MNGGKCFPLKRGFFPGVANLHSGFDPPQDYAGTRSDFVVVGHPEYNLGKACAEMGKFYEETDLSEGLFESL